MRCDRLPLFALLLLVACAQPVAPPSTTRSAPPAAAALRVATSGDYAPFSSIDSAGQRRGLDVALGQRFAADLGRQLDWTRFTWPALDTDVARGGFDVALSGVTMRADRALVGRFSRPYATTGAVAIVRAADATRFADRGALDRPGVRLAVNGGGHLERLTRARFPHATILPQADNARVPRVLRDGAADAAISDTAEAHGWLTPQLVALPPFSRDFKAALLPADHGALAAQLDDWLRGREADGWLNRERVHWLGDAAAMDAAAAARNAVAGLVQLRLALMPAVAAAKRAAHLPIEDRAQEARVLDRVRSQVPNDPARAAAVFGVLIELAKTIQRSAPALADPPTLDALRAALGRIDETLCAELNALPRSTPAQWRAVLAPAIADDVDALSAALAS
ncbi:MAG: transporter substrate-binding domain-containing protein [Deltaproteobacteria bacterium]|nr:transporter substrate-binding domain-containing protein [Deltaproteobacteria bacterium]